MRVLIAPDCFGGTLTAVDAARAIAAGWHRARPGDTVRTAPQSDGGPGFVEVLLAGRDTGMQPQRSRVRGPLADDVDAAWAYDPVTWTAYLESAQACGLGLLGGRPTPHTAMAAHSRGVGQLIEAALRRGARTVVVGLGGTGCTDGGRGMIESLGGPGEALRRLAGVRVVAATDVEHPLLGAAGAAHVFGPQKGADPAAVGLLEARLAAWADELERLCGRAVRSAPGAGAAGGLGFALLALGAARESGATLIAERTGLAAELAAADLIVTGEGRLDEQSPRGKVVGALARRAAGVPVLVLAGQVSLRPAALRAAGITAAYSLTDFAGSVRTAMGEAAGQLEGLAARAAGDWTGHPEGDQPGIAGPAGTVETRQISRDDRPRRFP